MSSAPRSRTVLLAIALVILGVGGGVALRLTQPSGPPANMLATSPPSASASPPPPLPTAALPAPVASPSSPTLPSAPAPAPAPASAEPIPTAAATPTPALRGPARFAFHGSRTARVVALTFDDGWSTAACRSVVGVLQAQHVTATFFPNAMYVRANPSFWHWLAAGGFPVGSHTTNHQDATRLAPGALIMDLESSRRIDDAILGRPSIPVLRPPFGSTSPAVLKAAAAAGFPLVVNWDVDSRDWAGGSSRSIVANSTRGGRGSVVLMHCGPSVTPRVLPTVIAYYRARGYSFVTIPTLFGLEAPTAFTAPQASVAAGATPLLPGAPAGVPQWNASLAARSGGGFAAAWEAPDGIWFAPDAATAGTPELVAATTDASFAMHPSLALDRAGGAHIAYLVATEGGINTIYRTRGPNGWEPPIVVANVGAPATAPSVAIAPNGTVWVAYGLVLHGSPPGIWLARRTSTGWVRTPLRSTNGTHLDPTLAFTRDGVAHVFTRRNGHWEVDETTWSGAGASRTVKAVAANSSAVSYTAADAAGRLWLAYQPTADSRIRLGFRTGGRWTWLPGPVADQAILSGLAPAPGGACVAFERADGTGIARAFTTCRTLTGAPLP